MRSALVFALFCIVAVSSIEEIFVEEPEYYYYCYGNCTEVTTKPTPGTLLIGGGTDVDAGFKWMAQRANGGNFVVIRTYGTAAYNQYIYGLGKLQSVATIVINSTEGANNDFVYETIKNAEALFIAGGDQWSYITYWNNSKVQEAIESLVRKGAPIGGTSAGLMVLGQYLFTAKTGGCNSQEALENPYNADVSLGTNFLMVNKWFTNLIFDTHFEQRDRMGRTITFLARIMKDYHSDEMRAISVDEATAVLVNEHGIGTIVNQDGQVEYDHCAYFMNSDHYPEKCVANHPLQFSNVNIQRMDNGDQFDFETWQPVSQNMGTTYSISAASGNLTSTQDGGYIY